MIHAAAIIKASILRAVRAQLANDAPSFKGEKGDSGLQGLPGLSVTGEKGDSGLQGLPGLPGLSVTGEKGDSVRGENGVDGRGLTSVSVSADGELIILLDDGDVISAGIVRGKAGREGKPGQSIRGDDGHSLVSASINDEGELILTLSDGQKINVGKVKGDSGPKGDRGFRGAGGAAGATSPASGVNGIAQLDFGAGNKVAEVVVTGVTAALTTSRVTATMRIESTASHPVDDLQIDPIRVMGKSLIAGVGFTVYGEMDNATANGLYLVDWDLSN